jgi:hypothetical protein
MLFGINCTEKSTNHSRVIFLCILLIASSFVIDVCFAWSGEKALNNRPQYILFILIFPIVIILLKLIEMKNWVQRNIRVCMQFFIYYNIRSFVRIYNFDGL